jgi:hypothetical protein
LLGVLPYGRPTFRPGFAVDHRQGKVTVLVYRDGRWERDEVNGAP